MARIRMIMLLVVLVILPRYYSWGACGGSSPNLTAASGSYADVKACIDIATYGDTVNIPAADGSATDWTTQITVTKNIRIVGAGIDVTKITSNITTNNTSIFYFVPDSTARTNIQNIDSVGIFEVTGITFTGDQIRSHVTPVRINNTELPAVKRIRVHHNKIVGMYAAIEGGWGYTSFVFDNNYIKDCAQIYYTGHISNEIATAAFFENYRIYPASDKSAYFEDNVVEVTSAVSEPWVTGGNNWGTGVVVRYNRAFGTANASGGIVYNDSHSNQLGIPGGQLLEYYGNNFTYTNSAGSISAISYVRGQKNIYLYNSFGGAASIIIRDEYNDHYSMGNSDNDYWTDDPLPIGLCASRTTYNGATQVCPGFYVGTPDSCMCWKVHDTYFLNNRYSGNSNIVATVVDMDYFHENNAVSNNPVEIVKDREYYDHVALVSYDGSSGVTCGTAAQMNAITPSTAGVGFWVPSDINTMPCTSVSADNIKQTFGTNPVTPITGTLYKWNGSAWKAFWIPYTYPHPLRGESEADTTAPTISGGISISGGSIQ